MKILDSGFRRNDEKKAFGTFYEIITFNMNKILIVFKNLMRS
jgi:hypothetical protein